MKTIAAVREHFDRLLMHTVSPVDQVTCNLAEDGRTLIFHAYLSDGETYLGDDEISASLDLSAEAASAFDSRTYIAALVALPGSRALH